MRQVLVVCGLHPAGLSMMLTGLRALGCQTGDFAPVRRPQETTGHYEWPAFKTLNQRLIAGEPPEELVQTAREMLAGFSGDAPIVLKDPMARRTLPFWQARIREFGLRPRVIFVLQRPGTAKVLAEAHWTQGLRRALRGFRGGEGDLVLVAQAALRACPGETMALVAQTLGLNALAVTEPDFHEWIMGHQGLADDPPQPQADTVTEGCYLGLMQDKAVVSKTADQVREILNGTPPPSARLNL